MTTGTTQKAIAARRGRRTDADDELCRPDAHPARGIVGNSAPRVTTGCCSRQPTAAGRRTRVLDEHLEHADRIRHREPRAGNRTPVRSRRTRSAECRARSTRRPAHARRGTAPRWRRCHSARPGSPRAVRRERRAPRGTAARARTPPSLCCRSRARTPRPACVVRRRCSPTRRDASARMHRDRRRCRVEDGDLPVVAGGIARRQRRGEIRHAAVRARREVHAHRRRRACSASSIARSHPCAPSPPVRCCRPRHGAASPSARHRDHAAATGPDDATTHGSRCQRLRSSATAPSVLRDRHLGAQASRRSAKSSTTSRTPTEHSQIELAEVFRAKILEILLELLGVELFGRSLPARSRASSISSASSPSTDGEQRLLREDRR